MRSRPAADTRQEQAVGGATTSGTNEQELVVVGVDGSAESVRALARAARYGTAAGARVQSLDTSWRAASYLTGR